MASSIPKPIHIPPFSLLFFGAGVVTLRDLCPQDKAKVRGLVEQLASVGQEKEELETAIEEDRRQFTLLLDRLKIEHKKVKCVEFGTGSYVVNYDFIVTSFMLLWLPVCQLGTSTWKMLTFS